jgi:hypothetical protein
MNTQSNSSTFKWLIIAVIALLALNAYQWYSNSQLKKENSVKEAQLFELEKIQTELDRDYQVALESIENLRDDTKSLNKLIDNQKKELGEQRDKINNLIWSKRELDKARVEIKKFQDLTTQYVAEINTLKTENDKLLAQNQKLELINRDLSTEVELERQLKSELEVAKASLTSHNEELSTTNVELSSKVDMGSAIKINYMEYQGFEVKDDGKLKKKDKAKKVDMMRICFLTETNMVTPSGEELFYVRVIDPLGETMAVESLGSGVLTDKLTNTKVRYSQSGVLDYQNKDTNGCIDWHPNYAFMKGVYDVEIYNKGYLVGKGDFKLK